MQTTQQALEDHFRSEVPSGWFDGPVTVLADSEEIVVIGSLPDGRPVDAFREESRTDRMAIAAKAEVKFRRKVTWGVEQAGRRTLFTSASVPVTTRLRFFERAVLDTLVEGGVARSRADALAWCVKLVARHQGEWLDDLRQAISSVEQVRQEGPTLL
jgi:hypothetical protein